jgi:hypothetical protein
VKDSFDGFRGDVDRRFGEMDKRIYRMSAVSAAYAGMALNTTGLVGRNHLGVGMGAENGKSALAVGYQRFVGTKSNVSVSLGGAFSGSERSSPRVRVLAGEPSRLPATLVPIPLPKVYIFGGGRHELEPSSTLSCYATMP